ncbi:hypothetical protein [Nostoc sp.]|uniref:hypothetical protein n=1 Tax=Nostoc sp. TaxID=1180 RepID=UPI002FF44FF2
MSFFASTLAYELPQARAVAATLQEATALPRTLTSPLLYNQFWILDFGFWIRRIFWFMPRPLWAELI